MKTLEYIRKEMDKALSEMEAELQLPLKDRDKKKVNKLLETRASLIDARNLLETNPTEDFLLRERDKTEALIATEISKFEAWKTSFEGDEWIGKHRSMKPNQIEAHYRKEICDIPKKEKFLNNLNFILNS